jgi:hypothetical protein
MAHVFVRASIFSPATKTIAFASMLRVMAAEEKIG